jgi:DNA polymerase
MSDESYPTATDYLPEERTYRSLRKAAKHCEGCPLHRDAKNVVFGRGPTDADLVLVGQSPRRTEDRKGKPFVGTAGKALDYVLEDANLSRSALYLTEAVKHIKWDGRMGKRTTQPPDVQGIEACRPWLEAELELIEPECIVALGKRAARSLLERKVRTREVRGQIRETQWGPVVATYHPLEPGQQTDDDAQRLHDEIVEDLKRAKKV